MSATDIEVPWWAADGNAADAPAALPSPLEIMNSIRRNSLGNIPSKQPSMTSSGMGPGVPVADNPDWGMTRAIAQDPKGFIKSAPDVAMAPFSVAGKILGAAAADVGTSLAGHPEYGGNLYEFFKRTSPEESAQPTPQQKILSEVSKTNPVIATAAKVATGLVETAPLIAASVEGLAGKLIALGFSADMISKAPQLARDLGTELGKPPDQRDKDKLTGLVSEAIQIGVFAPLAGAHGLRDVPGQFSSAFDTVNRTLPRPPIERTPNASSLETPATLHGNVLPLENPAKVLPTEVGGEGIQLRQEPAVRPDVGGVVPEKAKETKVTSGQEIADALGARYDGETLGFKDFTLFDKDGKGSTTLTMKPGSSLADVRAKYEGKIKEYGQGEKAPRPPKPAGLKEDSLAGKIANSTPAQFSELVKGRDQLALQNEVAKSESPETLKLHEAAAAAEVDQLHKAIDATDPKSVENWMAANTKKQFFSEALRQQTQSKVEAKPTQGIGAELSNLQKKAATGKISEADTAKLNKLQGQSDSAFSTKDQIIAVMRDQSLTMPEKNARIAELQKAAVEAKSKPAETPADKLQAEITADNNKMADLFVAERVARYAVDAAKTPEEFAAKQKAVADIHQKLAETIKEGTAKREAWDKAARGQPESLSPARPFFDRQSETTGLDRPSIEPTVEDVRAQRAADLKQSSNPASELKDATVESVPLDPQSGSPIETPPQPTASEPQGNPNVTGLAARVRAEREAAGMTAPTVPSEGIAPEASVERGRELLKAGVDPQKVMAGFEATKKLSADDIMVVRAHTEGLAKATNEAGDKFGHESDQFKAAFKTESDWAARTKAMQSEWAKQGHAQQGEVSIDTGSFTGLARAFKEDTGKDFTPKQADTAKKKAGKVKEADNAAAKAWQNLKDWLQTRIAGSAADRAAKAAADKTVREAAVRAAEAEVKANTRAASAAQELRDVQDKAAADAKAAADKTVREDAARRARAENAKRVADAQKNLRDAQAEQKTAAKKAEIANRDVRNAAARAAADEVKARVAQADTATYAWTKAKEYIEAGMDDFNDVVTKLATDLGMSADKIRKAMAKDKRAKFIADDVWTKQQTLRNLKSQAKTWLRQTAMPGYVRALQSVPRIMFGLKVGFHGTVALGTHAPMVAFQPPFWSAYVRDFGKMYKMVASKSYYEQQVQDLIRRPNYTTARRAGLVNDPFTYEDYNSPDTAKYLANLTGMGNRGYSVLKILRQDMFDQQWNQLPKTAQHPEVAAAIADGLNHATGVVKGRAPTGSNLALFAPRLEASRVAWLAVDPVKALASVADWKNATEGEKIFAINQFKEKAWTAGTLFSLLALNQGFLSATGSEQKVNMTDPMKSDFLKFKVAGMTGSYGNAMISMARLPVRLYEIRTSDGGKLKNLVHPDESSYSVLGEYARSQLSPFASLASSLWFKSDWQNRPLPNSTRSVPKRQAAQGVKPYTWPEFWSEQVLPIPFEEAAREVWKAQGMNESKIKESLRAMATISVMAATGGRLVEDQSPADVPYWAK